MYLNHYGLDKEPFHITPDPEFLYPSPSHREALASLLYGVRQRKGFVALTGEVGSGKTTVLRTFIKDIEGGNLHVLYPFSPEVRFKELLQSLVRGMKIETKETQTPGLLEAVHWGLIELYKQNRNLVLIIDEAHNMPLATLEKLRMLSNLETTKEKLLQIVLVGQPELDKLLQKHELRQLQQRIAVRAFLRPLTERESIDYIRHRVEVAGASLNTVFTANAAKAIARHANGSPRTINIVCDNALVAALGAGRRKVEESIVREVIRDMRVATGRRRWWWVPVAAGSMTAGILGAGALYNIDNSGQFLAAPMAAFAGDAHEGAEDIAIKGAVKRGADAVPVTLESMRNALKGLSAEPAAIGAAL